ncbi:Translation initiation factor eIF-2B subunit delta, putative isoform 2 [Theobroma cacao]|uniref:Translation initiation factor eIF-2B subunit delta, putative isoform 2 n=1 Tax=Theobroma cacao TaxID=3641 RepID=A0A061GE94_THECC|nr:Translation initiation factor eIF-2B subunit delta, putative isoform 2 [Theobroma cacao]
MDSHVGPTTATATATAGPTPNSPPRDLLDFIPVGSPEEEITSPPSEEDHDHDHDRDHYHYHEHGQDQDQNQSHDNSSATGVLTEDLKNKIIKQVEYYFSDVNLPTDKYMMSLIKKNKDGFVPISVIASFRKMKKLTRNYPSIITALKESSLLVVSSDEKKVKRKNPLPFIEVRDPKLFTVLVENLPEDHSVENIRRIFGEVGRIKNISIYDPLAVEESKKKGRADILISSKIHALVEYETVEAAEKAVATLNDEQDWRNGMRSKYGQRRQAWRGSDPEKNSTGRASDQTGDEENNTSSEHHEDIPDEEDGEHLSKDKNGHRFRNRGRARRQKHRGTNGLGHGSTSAHAIEPSKPPPGPRMPDGTRGFTMGRGRPLDSKQS